MIQLRIFYIKLYQKLTNINRYMRFKNRNIKKTQNTFIL